MLQDLLEIGHLQNQFSTVFQALPPPPQDFSNLPGEEVLENVDRKDLFYVPVAKIRDIPVLVRVTVGIDVPVATEYLFSTAEM